MARKFLYLVAILIMLTLAAAFTYRMFGAQLLRTALVPGISYAPQTPVADTAYAPREMWFSRPDIAGNPSLWLPPGVPPVTRSGEAAVFFVHPTSFYSRAAWNAPLGDRDADERAALFIQGQATAFNAVGEIWAPRYRQATFGAFLTERADAEKALDLAYHDVRTAFRQFLADSGDKRPIILAGHSQGALHLTRLLREEIAGKPVAERIVAAYVVGWPVSRETDLAALGLPECKRADQFGCILSWQSYAEPADPELVLATYDATTGFNGRSRAGTAMVCTNPLTGMPDDSAPATANLGTLVPAADLKSATLAVGAVPARCDRSGFLMIGSPPDLGPYVLPGNNYHVYDYSLFWGNVRADAARRLAAYKAG